MMVVLRDLRH